MKQIAVLSVGAILAYSLWAEGHARPAVGLTCKAFDTDLNFDMIINQFTGDLFENTFVLSVGGKRVSSQVKQYSNYHENIMLIASIGADADHDDVGYVIELNKSYNGNYSGRSNKYLSNPPGTRQEQDDSYVSINCQDNNP